MNVPSLNLKLQSSTSSFDFAVCQTLYPIILIGRMQFSSLLKSAFLLAVLSGALTPARCLNFSYPTFSDNMDDFITSNSRIYMNAIQVTPDVSTPHLIVNKSGRFLYKKPFKLLAKGKGGGSFNSTFVLKIAPRTNPGGEGMAFILTENPDLPEKSEGQWLGIVNETLNGTAQAKIVAVELDTRKSYSDDVDDNHVGLDVNSINSIQQVSLLSYGVNLSSETDYTVKVQYDSQNITVFVWQTNETREAMKNIQVLSHNLNLSAFFSKEVYVGFSGSTSNNTQLNCILSWDFQSSDIDEDSSLLWVWITVPIVLVLLTGVCSYLFWRRQGEEEDAHPRIDVEIQTTSMAPKKFKLKELQRATGRFNPKSKLGKGGFGTVYKGLLGNKEIAVKRVSKDSRQGAQEFIAEVTTIGSLRHKNLVKLIGWCYESHELLIVYEFMPNGSLDRFVFRDENLSIEIGEPLILSWERRHSIIFGVAQALDYLHNGCEKRVLHRDIKASNIMLDSDFNAKLGDFGLARTIQQSNLTHHSTKEIAGTPGYMAPETFLTGRATVETDVYAFGILVLEVVCGRRPGNQNEQNNYNNSIVYWLWDLYSSGMILDAVDSRLDGDVDQDDMACVLILGLACCHPNPHQRPCMRTVLKVLTREADPPELPTERPAFVWPAMPLSFKDDTESVLAGGQITPCTELTER